MARSRNSQGVASDLAVVQAQAAQLQARRAENEWLTRQRRASVALIRALGGHWQAQAASGAPVLRTASRH